MAMSEIDKRVFIHNNKDLILHRLYSKMSIPFNDTDSCWEYQTYKKSTSRIEICWDFNGIIRLHMVATRLMFTAFYGSYPEKKVQRVCHNPMCLNPHHFIDEWQPPKIDARRVKRKTK